jgi:putative endonuclease
MYQTPPAYRSTKFNLDDDSDLLKEVRSSGYNYYVYILECADQSYYTGLTNDLEARLYEHINGTNSNSYTYSRRPVQLKYFELFHIVFDAIRRENQIKRWSRKKKEAVFNSDWEKLRELSKARGELGSS